MTTTRRALLAGAAGLAAMGAARPGRRVIGLQLYTLGEDVGAHLEATLAAVRAIGFEAVELPQTYGREARALAAAMAGAGLACPSLHVPVAAYIPGALSFADGAERVADFAAALGARHVVAPMFPFAARVVRPPAPGADMRDYLAGIGAAMTADEWRAAGDRLNGLGRTLARSGVRLAYHNHNVEFRPMADGSRPYDLMIGQTDPALVDLEVDLGWIAAAGLDPAEFVRRHAARVRLVHVKDQKATPTNYALRTTPADLGDGVTDWPAVLRATRAAGVAHYFIEREPPYTRPRIDSARTDFGFLRRALARA